MSSESPTTRYSSADATRAKILQAAKTLFVKNGYAGTSIGKIAALIKINHSLIFHHFKNKQNLWSEVKQSIVQQASKNSTIMPKLEICFTSFLKKLIDNSINFYRNNPDIIHMLNWQRIEHKQQPNIGITGSGDMPLWITAIRHYQDTDDINPKLKPEFIITFILAVVSSAALDPNSYIEKPKEQNAYLDFSLNVIINGIKSSPISNDGN